MVCGTCGTTNPTGQKFCGECGSLLAAPAVEVRKTVTVVFCDLVGSTALGESVDAEVLRGVMGRFHAELRRVLEQHGGTVEKFVGDAAMAVFGVPQLHEDDALRAVRAAVLMREAAAGLGLEVRIGVNTGEVVVGTGETLATGDAVNVAARLEQAAGAGTILVGEQTARLVRGHVALEAVEPLVLKGKAQPVAAYAVAALDDDAADPAEWPLVGRDHELAVLEEACRQAAEKRVPQLVTVVGHPGVGKSRLVAELLGRVAGQHLVGHCLPYGEGITYWPLVEILEALGDLDDALAGAAERDEVTVRLAAALGTAGAAATAEEIAWAFRRLLETLARDRLVVVVLDDIHWAEPTMLDLVEHVASLARDAALVLLCTARPDLYDVRPGWASPRPASTTLTLDPLGPEQAAALARELGVESEADLLRIVEASDGNPLFVQQLVAVGREGREGDGSAPEVPPDLQALLAARIDRLDEPERQVIERAAVEGRLFHRGAVTELLPPPQRPEVARCLVGLVRRELVRPDQALIRGDDGFRFGHMLIRDAAYDSIAKRVRADLHERYADWLLERLGPEAPQEIVGHHLAQAHSYRPELGEDAPALRDRAGAVLGAAARAAAERRDVTAAATLFERALDLTPDDPPRRHLLLDYVPVLQQRGAPHTESLLAEVVELATAAGDDQTRWVAEVRLAAARIQRGVDGAVAEAAALVETVLSDAADDHLVLAHAFGLKADLEGMRGRMGSALEALDHGFRHGRSNGVQRLQVDMAHHMAGAVVYGPASVAEGRRRMAQLEEELGHDPAIQGIVRHVRAHLDAREGHFEGAAESLGAWRHHFREIGMDRYFAITASCEWDVARLSGDVERGERELREGYAILERMGDRLVLCTIAASLGEAALGRGDLDEADFYAAQSQEYGDPDDYQNEASWRGVRARALSARGRHAEAVALAEEAVALAATTDEIEQEASNRADLAHVLRASGRPDRAASAAASALALYERKGNVVAAGRMTALIEELGRS